MKKPASETGEGASSLLYQLSPSLLSLYPPRYARYLLAARTLLLRQRSRNWRTKFANRPLRHDAAEALFKPAKKVAVAAVVERRALPNVKEPVSLKLDSDVLAYFQADGPAGKSVSTMRYGPRCKPIAETTAPPLALLLNFLEAASARSTSSNSSRFKQKLGTEGKCLATPRRGPKIPATAGRSPRQLT